MNVPPNGFLPRALPPATELFLGFLDELDKKANSHLTLEQTAHLRKELNNYVNDPKAKDTTSRRMVAEQIAKCSLHGKKCKLETDVKDLPDVFNIFDEVEIEAHNVDVIPETLKTGNFKIYNVQIGGTFSNHGSISSREPTDMEEIKKRTATTYQQHGPNGSSLKRRRLETQAESSPQTEAPKKFNRPSGLYYDERGVMQIQLTNKNLPPQDS